MTVLVGGVSQLYQGDLDFGRLATGRLAEVVDRADVLVEELHYGAVAVAQRLEELDLDALVLVGAESRGEPPGRVRRRRLRPLRSAPEEAAESIRDAVTGYVTVDLLVEVASALDVLPERAVAIEVEPASIEPGSALSGAASAVLDDTVRMVLAEVDRMALLGLADRLRELVTGERLDPAPAVQIIRELLDQLAGLDESGAWGRTFALRDHLREAVRAGRTPERMEHLDWSLWWALLEELDRLQAADATP